MGDVLVIAVELDLDGNRIVLVARSGSMGVGVARSTAQATVDIGTGGRLLGVETGDDYVVVADADDALARSTQVDATIGRNALNGALVWISLPRAGPNHEITWPSGNQ